MSNEPVLSYGLIVAAISAGLAMLIALGVLELTDEQFAAVMTFVSAVAVLGAAVVRQYVRPLSKQSFAEREAMKRELARK